ncbi:hypothetical protein [Cryobacterium sp. Hz9]|uniref:hypothetical protein n=1 Tax=Cryobacterium sp. Hz9 TaxID=1259167 RepID=UPI001069B4FA|nr:hypothetical protein [Cryobacterium sp. Hz9]TFB69201.1 hypothetical protein E3N85_04130 [Cryobacterium sp. Hz9]
MADEIVELFSRPVLPSFVIKPQQIVTRSLFVSGRSMHFNAAWPGSDVIMTLISPSGVRYDRSNTREAVHGNGPTYEYFDIDNPEQGTWTAAMFGADVDPAGEPVSYTAADQPVPNVKPTASFTTSGSGTTYRFDASASTDLDGSVEEYMWELVFAQVRSREIARHKEYPHVFQGPPAPILGITIPPRCRPQAPVDSRTTSSG